MKLPHDVFLTLLTLLAVIAAMSILFCFGPPPYFR